MDNQLPELKVNMLGRFSITYGEQPITFKRNSATKAVKLLQILLHSSLVEDRGSTGILRAQLLGGSYRSIGDCDRSLWKRRAGKCGQ